jgi:chromosome segregation ATPase
MFKKLGFLALLVVGGILLVRTGVGVMAWKKAKQALEDQKTPEQRVEALKEEVANLDKDLKKHLHTVAEERVAVRELRQQIADGELNQAKRFDAIVAMRAKVKSGEAKVKYGDQEYSIEYIKDKLAGDWKAYKDSQETIKNQKALLKAKEQSLMAVEEELASFRSRREQLEVAIAQVETEIKTIRLAQAKSKVSFNEDSRFGQIQKELQKLHRWTSVQKEQMKLESQYTQTAIPVEKGHEDADKTMKEIDEAVGQKSAK